MMKAILTFLSVILISSLAWGANEYNTSFVDVTDIESLIEKRVREMVRPIDPHAQVFVTVQLVQKKVDGYLPGTAMDMENLSGYLSDNGMFAKRVKKLQIKIYTQHEKFPGWLKKEVIRSFNLPREKIRFAVSRLDANSIELIKQQKANPNIAPAIDSVFTRFQDMVKVNSGFVNSMSQMVAALFAFIFLFMFWMNLRNQRIFRKEIRTLASAIKDSADANTSAQPFIDVAAKKKIEDNNVTQLPQRQGHLELDGKQLLAMMSDCYWCHQDEYAAYIWKNISNSYREELLSNWEPAADYVRSLTPLAPRNLELEDHPSYLSPLPIENISQEDLYGWLKMEPGAWSRLSPLRQKHMDAPIQDRIQFMNAPTPEGVNLDVPGIYSEKRILVTKQSGMDLNIEDEELLIEQPEIIPEMDRDKFPTLVWLAGCDLDYRKMTLDQLSARDLALAWTGPEAVLDRLAEALPEKKKKLVKEYSSQIRPDRNSEAFIFLFQQGIEKKDAA